MCGILLIITKDENQIKVCMLTFPILFFWEEGGGGDVGL